MIKTTVSNLFLSFFKILTGFLVGSIALIASGFDALTDLIASLTVFLGLRFSQKDPSKRFSYGYYRLETLATLIVAIFILIFGLDVLIISIQIIIVPTSLNIPELGLITTLVSIFIAYFLYKYNLKIGNKIASNAMVSTAKEFQLDILTNSLVFVGIFAHIITFPQLEGFVGIVISFFIIKTGVEFGLNSLLTLVDAIDDPKILEEIRSIIQQFPEIQKITNIRIRRSGPYYFADIEIKMLGTMTVKAQTNVTHQLETTLKEKISHLDSIMISVEPIIKTQFKVAIPVSSIEIKDINPPCKHFGLAPAFLISSVDIPTQKILTTNTVENPHRLAERKRGLLVAEFLVKRGVDILIVKDLGTFGIGPKAILSDNNIQLYEFNGETIQDIIKKFMKFQKSI